MSGDPEHSFTAGVRDGKAMLRNPRLIKRNIQVAGIIRRWNWRLHHRFGARHWDMTDAQIRRELRAMSWKRAL